MVANDCTVVIDEQLCVVHPYLSMPPVRKSFSALCLHALPATTSPLGATQTFVLFPSSREDSDDDDNETFGTGSEGQGDEPANVSAPPPIVRLTPKAGLASEYRARFFAQPAAAATAEAGGEEGGFVGDSTDWGEKRREVEVVVQETALQRRVEAERTRLATKVRMRLLPSAPLATEVVQLFPVRAEYPYSLFYLLSFRVPQDGTQVFHSIIDRKYVNFSVNDSN